MAKTKQPKVVRRAAKNGGAVPANISLSIETLQLSHEALVQMRKPNAQVTLAVARAMNELEGLIQVFGIQQQAQQAQAQAAQAEGGEAPAQAPAPAPAPAAAPAKAAKRRKR